MNPSVLFVDDEPNVLRSYERALRRWRDLWTMSFIGDPVVALETAERTPPDAIVLDVRMPGLDGIQFLNRARRSLVLRDVPTILVTGEADKSLKRKALDLGAADLLSKPVDDDDLVARVRSVLTIKFQADALREHAETMEERVRLRTAGLRRLVAGSLTRLARLAALRDGGADDHVGRVGRHAARTALAMGFDREFAEAVGAAAPLHDIGNLVAALGESSPALVVPSHCQLGERLLADKAAPMPSFDDSREPVDLPLRLAASIARSHHEQWNGGGFPDGRCLLETPVEARIVAVCDAFDVARRIHGRPLDEAIDLVRRGRGEKFDPEAVAAFLASMVDEPIGPGEPSSDLSDSQAEGSCYEASCVRR